MYRTEREAWYRRIAAGRQSLDGVDVLKRTALTKGTVCPLCQLLLREGTLIAMAWTSAHDCGRAGAGARLHTSGRVHCGVPGVS